MTISFTVFFYETNNKLANYQHTKSVAGRKLPFYIRFSRWFSRILGLFVRKSINLKRKKWEWFNICQNRCFKMCNWFIRRLLLSLGQLIFFKESEISREKWFKIRNLKKSKLEDEKRPKIKRTKFMEIIICRCRWEKNINFCRKVISMHYCQ